MNIVICEDDKNYCSYMVDVLSHHIHAVQSNSKIVKVTSDIDDIMKYIENNAEITIYYLDIKLCGSQNGFYIASKIRERDYLSHIIFVTNYGELMPLTYEYKLEALDYIVKENTDEMRQRICAALDFAEQRQHKGYIKCLNIQNKQKNFSIPFEEICYIESIKSSHKLQLYYDTGIITFYGLLKDIQEQLDDRFLRCHKSIIINVEKIVSVDKQQHIVVLGPGYTCSYSAKYKERLEK